MAKSYDEGGLSAEELDKIFVKPDAEADPIVAVQTIAKQMKDAVLAYREEFGIEIQGISIDWEDGSARLTIRL